MIRKQVYITERQEKLLKRLSENGGSEAEMIRVAIDRHLSSVPLGHYNPDAWKQAHRLIQKRQKIRVPPLQRSWTRDDAYEHLVERYGPDPN